jgi:hypothetical protein
MSDDETSPQRLSAIAAVQVVRLLARNSGNIVVIKHARRRLAERKVTRIQVERCLRNGTISEGPFMNLKGHWQLNLTHRTAGDEVTCVVSIEWKRKLIVVTVF